MFIKAVKNYSLEQKNNTVKVKTLATTQVNDLQETATSTVEGYIAKRSATGTKTDTAILETSQSISVVGQQEMTIRGAENIIEVMRYVPGVQAEQYGQDDRGWEWFSIRGFENFYDNNYLNGLRQPGSGSTQFQTESYGLERVEVLRGPSSVLYGQGDVGGIINRVKKTSV